MSEVEKRAWLSLMGAAMGLQGLILLASAGYWNTHLYLQVALWYSNREARLSGGK